MIMRSLAQNVVIQTRGDLLLSQLEKSIEALKRSNSQATADAVQVSIAAIQKHVAFLTDQLKAARGT